MGDQMRYLVVLLLAGCASTSQPLSLGADRYTVTAKMSGNLPAWEDVRALGVKAATEHCSTLGRQMVDADIRNSGARGWTPISAEVTFRCVEKK